MKRNLVIALAACVVVVVGLAGYELYSASLAAKTFPAPERFVEIDGRKLQIDCRGSGFPTVVLETGGNGIAGPAEWGTAFDDIARSTRVCSYSRAGYLWSDSNPSFSDESGARDLHAALFLANEQPPFVLVAHSRGAFNQLIFADLFADDVAGLVFLDPTHPDLVARKSEAGVRQSDIPVTSVKFLRALRWTGLPRVYADFCELDNLSTPDIEVCKAYFPHSLDGIASENAMYDKVAARGRNVRSLGEKPLIVLTRQWKPEWYSSDPAIRAAQEKEETLWRNLNAEIAALSSKGEQRFVPDSIHSYLMTRPQAMLTAVNEMVDLLRRPSVIGATE
jgi:pimeloyl-ACP methyl ester carboxylesterase